MGVMFYTKETNEPDPVTGLTPKERSLVISSWNLVKKDMTGNGVELFMMFFQRQPDYQRYFPFRDVPMEELPNHKKLKAHATNVMYTVSSIIDNLDHGELSVNLLEKTGKVHRKFKVPPESFDVLHKTMLDLLQRGLGPQLTREAVDAWDKTLTVAMKVIKARLTKK